MSGIATDDREAYKGLTVQIKHHYLPNMAILNKWLMIYATKYDLLSPIYKYHKRGGCWFCPNATWRVCMLETIPP